MKPIGRRPLIDLASRAMEPGCECRDAKSSLDHAGVNSAAWSALKIRLTSGLEASISSRIAGRSEVIIPAARICPSAAWRPEGADKGARADRAQVATRQGGRGSGRPAAMLAVLLRPLARPGGLPR